MANEKPLNGYWLAIAEQLWWKGPTHRLELRHRVGLTNRRMKFQTRLMKASGLIKIRDGVVDLTSVGRNRYREAMR